MDTKTKMKLKSRLLELKQEKHKLGQLMNIAKPADLPQIKKSSLSSKSLPLFGKMRGRGGGLKSYTVAKQPSKPAPIDDEFKEELL